MGKLYLYYKKYDKSMLGNMLKVKVDDTITLEVSGGQIFEVELHDGTHNIKMYYDGWSEGELVGYVDQNIEIAGNTYFTYKGPATIYGKGKLIQNKFNSFEEFKKSVENKKKIYSVISIILWVICIIIWLLF